MKKKLQIFISSTYSDLVHERQTAVKAVLKAGHIPAGMELFRASDLSQQEIIKKWIEESDAFMLIIGGRYGSLLPSKDKSYTQWEYEDAGKKHKPRFVVLLSDQAIQNKIKEMDYTSVIEQDEPGKYKEFVTSIKKGKLVNLIDDSKDIEIAIANSLKEIEQNHDLPGWISGKNISDITFKSTAAPLEIKNQIIRDQRVELDNKNFIDCKFDNCILVYKGENLFGLQGCGFRECNWVLEKYAGHTMRFLNSLYHGFGEGGRIIAEELLNSIRNKNSF